jgi:hypothetical protein
MAEENPLTPPTPPTETVTPPEPDDSLSDAGKKAIAAERKAAREATKERDALAARLKELEDRDKTEAQKLADRAALAERERDEARLDALRVKVGASKKLPADVVELLRGETEAELAAHADRLAEHFKAASRPAGSVDQGNRGAPAPDSPGAQFASFLNQQMR